MAIIRAFCQLKFWNFFNFVYQYRVIVRTSELRTLRGAILEDDVPSASRHGGTRGLPHKDVLEAVTPELQISALKVGQPGEKVQEQLIKLDEQGISSTYKVGIMYCQTGQSSEEEMYNNEHAGPNFDKFLAKDKEKRIFFQSKMKNSRVEKITGIKCREETHF